MDEYNKAIVVDFFATWCNPCMQVSPLVDRLAKKNPTVKFIKFDISERKERKERKPIPELKVTSLPTFRFFKNGQQIEELPVANVNKLKFLVDEYK